MPAVQAYQPPPAASTLSERRVLLLVDTFASHFEPRIAQAAYAVLHAAGYQVEVLRPLADDAEPSRSLCCGRTYLSLGQVEAARAEAARLHAALAPALASGARPPSMRSV